jgi:hypothetical protein
MGTAAQHTTTIRTTVAIARTAAVLAVALVTVLTATAAPAGASTAVASPPHPAGAAVTGSASSTVQQQVDAYLAEHPGGNQINPTEIAYPGGFVVALAPVAALAPPAPNLAAAADCPSGWFCFYDGINYRYPRGRLSDCGFQDLARWGWTNRTESVHYNMSSGSVTFYNHTSSGDTPLFTISTTRRTDNDVSPYRNQADRVYRTCT